MTDFRLRRLRVFAKGALSGLLLAFAFPPLNLFPLAFVGLVPVLWTLDDLAVHGRGRPLREWSGRAFGLGFSCAFAYFLALIWWIVMLDAPALTIPWVRYPGVVALVGYLALYFGFFGVAYAWIRARTAVHPVVVAPALWVVADVARGYWELGFPWGHLGYSQAHFLPALQMASVTGVHGMTAWLVICNALLLRALRPGHGNRVLSGVALVGIVAVPIFLGWQRIQEPIDAPTIRVALVQPNIGNKEKWAADRRAEHFESMADLSRQGVAQGAELVVWPETAAPTYLLRDQKWRPWILDFAGELGRPLFIGFPDIERLGPNEVKYANSGALFVPPGAVAGKMDKIKLVPFGERLPFDQVFPILKKVDFGEADFTPGDAPVVLDVNGTTFGALICFEAIYPKFCRQHEAGGIDLFVTITNDSWFGAGSGARQHADMAVTRCVETGLGMARAANSGISLGADAYGRTFGETGLFTREVSVVDVPLRQGRTFYARTGDWAVTISVLASLALLVSAWIRRKG
ncbi:MAG: apolipoprotein N-acyltransferase [Gemmatimonadetes bacterium]|nr:apolipoprotein N-acyltransferase [Gemmatimonadota bacterium]